MTATFNPSLLTLDWASGHQSVFPAIWLRDNCPMNRDQRTGQRLVDVTDLPSDPQIESIELGPDTIRVCWAGEDRGSIYPLSWLLARCLCEEHLRESRPKIATWTRAQSAQLCSIDHSAVCADRSALLRWLRSINCAWSGVP